MSSTATRAHAQLPLLNTAPATPLPVLDTRARGASFHEIPVKAILNSPAATGMGFWSLNPYVGCEFGCTYCYARETHKWRIERAGGPPTRHPEAAARPKDPLASSRDPSGPPGPQDDSLPPTDRPTVRPSDRPAWDAFERQILVKTSAAAVLKRTLFPAKLAGCTLVIGTATDPYQPAERQFRLTRQILEALLSWKGLALGIITKSPLIIRDIDLLVQLKERHELSVNISIASTDAALLRRIEARSPAPHARLRALSRLTENGIHAGLLIAPVLPGITDSRESLAALMAAGKAAGARYAVGSALRLGPATRSRFLPHLAHEFPELAGRYARRYENRQMPGRDYTEALSARIRALQAEYGFPVPDRRHRERLLKGQAREAAVPDAAVQWSLSL